VRVALLFIDGVGVGDPNPVHNPLARETYLLSQFRDGSGTVLPGRGRRVDVDATFGVPGRPQSATNQTALLTGEPAPRLLGRHLLGFPNAALRAVLDEKSVVKRLVQAGRRAEFVNCYPAGYLDAMGLPRHPSTHPDVEIPERAKRRLKPSATTCAFAAGHVPLRTFDDARRGQGLTHDILGGRARARGFDVPTRRASEAAQIFWNVAQGVDLTLFEHFLADETGHAQDERLAEEALSTFDAFAREVVAQRPDDALVVICSDHGNVEDLSTRQHTLAQVPVLLFGGRGDLGDGLEDLASVGRLVLREAGG
jgi:hypothetical protein